MENIKNLYLFDRNNLSYNKVIYYANNSIINISIQGKYTNSAPQIAFVQNVEKSGDLANLSKTLLLKDEYGIDAQNKSFSYVIQKVGNDSTFKDLT